MISTVIYHHEHGGESIAKNETSIELPGLSPTGLWRVGTAFGKLFLLTPTAELAMQSSSGQWNLKGLGADGPLPDQEANLSLFGQFVGDWVGQATFLKDDGTEIPGGKGEVHFRWILDGRAVQDVWMREDPASKKMISGGTTLRFYDPEKDAWQSTWISPIQNTTLTFIGREAGGEIVLEAVNKRGRMEHWIFYDIMKDSSFKWRAESSDDGGKTWKLYARYRFEKAGNSR